MDIDRRDRYNDRKGNGLMDSAIFLKSIIAVADDMSRILGDCGQTVRFLK